MNRATLVIMAAGIGSRFGGGIKQLEPVGPNGEIIMDYSIHDALEAGFNKIVFIIRKDLEEDFKEIGPWIKGCGDYYLQNFTESGQVLEPGVFSGFGKEELEGFAQLVRPYVGRAALRGIDY